MRLTRAIVVASLALAVAPAMAQDTRVEISPYGGWRWGGEIDIDTVFLDEEVDVDESEVYGLRLNFALSREFQIELLAAHQPTSFTSGDDDLFGDDDRDLLDVDLETLQVGMLFQGGYGQMHPYGVVGFGVTRFDPDGDVLDEDERLSASFGGGLKVMVSRNVGFRFEGRYYWTDTGDDDECDDDDFFDDDDDCWEWNGGLNQGEVTVGLVLAL